jgi:hypothetical protein
MLWLSCRLREPIIMWVYVLLLILILLLLPKTAGAKVYRCEGAGGTTILTDQPKGKRGCEVVTTTSASPPGGYTPPANPVPAVPLNLPPATMPQSPAPRQPFSTDPSSTTPTAANDSSAQAAPEAQHCSPRINPLNPFAGLNCSPASGTGETKKP